MSLDIHDLLEVYRIAIRTDKGIPLVHRRTALEMFGKARRHWRQDHPDAA